MYSRIKHQGYGIKSFLSELGSQLTDKACQLIESQLESEVDVWLSFEMLLSSISSAY